MTDRIIIIKGQAFPVLLAVGALFIAWWVFLSFACIDSWDRLNILSRDLRRLEIRVAKESRPLVVTGKYNRVIFGGEEIDSGVSE